MVERESFVGAVEVEVTRLERFEVRLQLRHRRADVVDELVQDRHRRRRRRCRRRRRR